MSSASTSIASGRGRARQTADPRPRRRLVTSKPRVGSSGVVMYDPCFSRPPYELGIGDEADDAVSDGIPTTANALETAGTGTPAVAAQ